MPRKRERKTDGYYDIFPERLRKIMEERGTTQQELADHLGKSRQAIGYYTDGSSTPDWKTLAGLARYFGISADWLLGLSDVSSTNVTVKEMCKYTGLTEDVITMFSGMSDEDMQTINFMIMSYPFKTLVRYMTFFLSRRDFAETKKLQEDDLKQVELSLVGTRYTIVDQGELLEIYRNEAVEAFQRIFYSDVKTISLKDI